MFHCAIQHNRSGSVEQRQLLWFGSDGFNCCSHICEVSSATTLTSQQMAQVRSAGNQASYLQSRLLALITHRVTLWSEFCWHYQAVILSPSCACFFLLLMPPWWQVDRAGRRILVCKQQTQERKELTKCDSISENFRCRRFIFHAVILTKPYPCVSTEDLLVHPCTIHSYSCASGMKWRVCIWSFPKPLQGKIPGILYN